MALFQCNVITDAQGREMDVHGTVAFPAGACCDHLEEMSVPWHWHEDMEAVVMIRGSAAVAVGGENLLLKAGEGCFINAGTLHELHAAEPGACWLHGLVFHPRLVGGSADSVFWQKYVSPLCGQEGFQGVALRDDGGWQTAALAEIEAAWSACAREEDGYELEARASLSRLLHLLRRNCAEDAQHRPSARELRDAERMKRMFNFIQAHLDGEMNVAEIAASAAISESECLRCFRSTIGMPPVKYVRRVRLEKAAELLRGTRQSVTEIGFQCGFQNSSYFIRRFREWKGCTPAEYRAGRRNEGTAANR